MSRGKSAENPKAIEIRRLTVERDEALARVAQRDTEIRRLEHALDSAWAMVNTERQRAEAFQLQIEPWRERNSAIRTLKEHLASGGLDGSPFHAELEILLNWLPTT